MKNLKKSALLIFLTTVGLAAAQGQPRDGHDFDPTERAARQTERMADELGLSAEQAAKVKDINLKYAEKAKDKHDAKAAEKDKDKAEREALRNEHDAELKKVLTKEQAAKWEQNKSERKEGKGDKGGPGGRHGKGGHDPAKQTERMTKDLDLNAEQAAKVKAINEKYAEKAKNGDKALREEHEAELKKVLTKEQAAKFEQRKAERKAGRGKGGHGKHKD